jgi:hypothetical protein
MPLPLFCEVGEDYVARRLISGAHFEKVWKAQPVLGGALAKPLNGAVLLFRGDSPDLRSLIYLNCELNPRIRKCL